MKTRGWYALSATAILAGAMVTTGCDKFDRFHSVAWRKQKYMESGKKYFDQKKFSDAKIQFMRVTRLDPKFSEGFYQLGRAEIGTREGSRAYKAFQAAVAADPKNTNALQEMATLELMGKKYEDAKADAQKILAIAPNDSKAQETLAYALAGMGDLEGLRGRTGNAIGARSRPNHGRS